MITEDSPRIPPFRGLPYVLKDHQLALIYKTIELEDENTENEILVSDVSEIQIEVECENEGETETEIQIETKEDVTLLKKNESNFLILADHPGAGKTNVVLGHCYMRKLQLLRENPELDEDDEERDPTFIVVPQNILTQWIENINRYFPRKLRYKKMTSYEELMGLYKNTKVLYKYDIILITPLEYNMICSIFQNQNVVWNRIVFDEIDTISGMIQQKTNTKHVWFVSASFKKDRIGTYYSSYTEEEIDAKMIYCDPDFISKSFPLPEPIISKYISINKHIDETLYGMVTEKELKGINALDYSLVKNEYYKIVPNTDEGVCELVVEENRNEIEFYKMRLDDMKKEKERFENELEADGIHYDIKIVEENEDSRLKMIREYHQRIIKTEDMLVELENKKNQIRTKVSKNRICMICYQDIDMKKVEDNGQMKPLKEIMRCECCQTDYCVSCIDYLYEVEKRIQEMKKREEELKKKQNQSLQNESIEVEEQQQEFGEEFVEEEVEVEVELEESQREETKEERYRGLEIECKKCDTKSGYHQFRKVRFVKRRNKNERNKDRTSKTERFEQIIQQTLTPESKYIVFSDFYNTFRFVKDVLNKLQVKYIELDGGNQISIDKSVKEYREGESQVLLSNSTFFGCGLNMEFTTHIIFMHKMEKGTEKQVIGRAQRPGRTSPLYIHYLFYYNEEFGDEITYDSHTDFYSQNDINEDDIEEIEEYIVEKN